MELADIYCAIMDSLVEEIVFVDADHIIRYMNPAAQKHYSRFGDVIGQSLFACHNKNSIQRIKDIFAQLKAGKEEVIYIDDDEHQVFMRAVRDNSGKLVGYYERYASPRKDSERRD